MCSLNSVRSFRPTDYCAGHCWTLVSSGQLGPRVCGLWSVSVAVCLWPVCDQFCTSVALTTDVDLCGLAGPAMLSVPLAGSRAGGDWSLEAVSGLWSGSGRLWWGQLSSL